MRMNVYIIEEYDNQGFVSTDRMAFKEFEGALNTAVNLIEYQFGGHSGYEYDINKRDGVVCLYYNGVLTRRYDIVQIPLF